MISSCAEETSAVIRESPSTVCVSVCLCVCVCVFRRTHSARCWSTRATPHSSCQLYSSSGPTSSSVRHDVTRSFIRACSKSSAMFDRVTTHLENLEMSELDSGQGKVRENGKSQGKVREFDLVWRVVTLLFALWLSLPYGTRSIVCPRRAPGWKNRPAPISWLDVVKDD